MGRNEANTVLLSEANHKAVNDAIDRVYAHAREVPGLILTESDLKCHLFIELSKWPEFSTPIQTQEGGIFATPLHTEVSWFDKNEQLTIKPDVTILSPEHLSIFYKRHTRELPPRKQFSFDGQAFIFELKFIRGPDEFTSSKLKKIKGDFKKIESLFERLGSMGAADETYCYHVLFSRYDCADPDWNHFLNEKHQHAHWNFIYRTLGLPPPDYAAPRPAP